MNEEQATKLILVLRSLVVDVNHLAWLAALAVLLYAIRMAQKDFR